jgi:hypothetical protein
MKTDLRPWDGVHPKSAPILFESGYVVLTQSAESA